MPPYPETVKSTGRRDGIVYNVADISNGWPDSISKEWMHMDSWEDFESSVQTGYYPVPENGRLVWQAYYR